MKDIALIVDDDAAIRTMLCKILKSNDIDVDLASDGEEALEKINAGVYSIVLLDINMHGIDGFEVIKIVRRKGINTPIIVVSGRKADYDTLYGLDIGADDYITKPFNPVTLGAKVKALIRRSKGENGQAAGEIIEAGPFRYDIRTLRFYKNGEEIPLSSKENAMVKLFIDNIGRIFSKDMIYSMIWGDTLIDENAIMVYINRLRQKIEDNPSSPVYIQTVRGVGYKFIVE
ncbi:MAG: response regulator transcription factor [Firmicutes bacterium]|nr:response regulator transcription factor [Bacillota bacterium]